MFFSQRFSVRGIFALIVLSCLFTALLFTGCKQEPDENPKFELDSNLIETWTSSYGDSYTITSTHLTYYSYGNTISYAGTIKHAAAFSSTAGVIIFEYDANHKATYYADYDPVTYEPIGDPLPLKGNFIGVYYKELKPGVSVQMGTAYAEGGPEQPTLDAAKKAFTLGKEGDYMSYYGTYTK